jgi:hypothetical protein
MRVLIEIPGSLRAATGCAWLAAAAAAWLLLPQDISVGIRIPFLMAACLELACYLAPGWERLRNGITGQYAPAWIAAGLWVSALLPYAVYALATGMASWGGAAVLALLTGMLAFWYAVFRGRSGAAAAAADVGFLALLATVMLAGIFRDLYPDAAPKLQAEFLGRLMWIRLGIAAALLLRKMPGTGFGFWPSLREWKAGVIGFAVLLPVLLALGGGLDFFRIRELTRPAWQMAFVATGSFFGFLWVVALSEEFFLRGLLQQWASGWTRSPWRGLAIATAVSGAVHLPFGGQFPNWKFAALATVAHAGYGLVFLRGGGVRAAMVTHALVVTVWRVFLR